MKRYGIFVIRCADGMHLYQNDFNDRLSAEGLAQMFRWAALEYQGTGPIQIEYQPTEHVRELLDE